MNEEPIYYSDNDDAGMITASKKAQETFKYFWRELYWEYRRIVPAYNLAIVKVVFSQEIKGQIEVEHMWMDQIDFDGDLVYGTLINQPNTLTNVKDGDLIKVPISQISDWLLTSDTSMGGFTIQLIRSRMNDKERREHDEAWGIDFGDYKTISVVYEEKEHPENLIEHPMSINMKSKIEEYFVANPKIVDDIDDRGFSLLHGEAIAGNKTVAEVLLKHGANRTIKSPTGKTAYDYAVQLGWDHMITLLKD